MGRMGDPLLNQFYNGRPDLRVEVTTERESIRDLLEEARAFLDTRHATNGQLARPANLIQRIDAALSRHP